MQNYELKTTTTKIDTVHYRYEFSDKEVRELLIEANKHNEEYDRLESCLSSIKKDFAGKMEAAENSRGTALRKGTDGFEMRETEAVIEFHPAEKRKAIYFYDETMPEKKGGLIREEPMTPSDFQRELFEEKKAESNVTSVSGVTATNVPTSGTQEAAAKLQIANEAQARE